MLWSKRSLAGLSILLILALLVGGAYFAPELLARLNEDPYTKTDVDEIGERKVLFTVRYATPEYAGKLGIPEDDLRLRGNAQLFVISANVHRGDLKGLTLERKVFLIDAEGRRYPSLVRPFISSDHHLLSLAYFPRRGREGRPLFDGEGFFDVEIKGVAQARTFRFTTPFPPESRAEVKNVLMLTVAMSGLLILALSPCAISTYSFMTYIFTAAAGRNRPVGKIFAFGLGYTAILLLGGGFILLFSSQMSRFPALLRPVEIGAGIFVALVALSLFLPRRSESSKQGLAGRLVRSWTPEGGLLSHFLLGLALAVGCLQCMGTVGLSLLLPLLAYSGLTSWFWGLTLLGIFSFGLLVPFLLAAFGLEGALPSLGSRVKLVTGLRWSCSLILLATGGLMVAGESMRMTSAMFWLVDQIHRAVDVICRPFLA